MRAAVALVIMLLTAATLRAQGTDDFRDTARTRLGPLYVNPTLQIREIGVDTNVFNSFDNPQSDFTTTLGPQVESWLPLGSRVMVKLVGGADLVYYATYTNQRSINGNYSARSDVKLNRVTLFATDTLFNTRDRPRYEIDIRPRHVDNAVGGGSGFQRDNWQAPISMPRV